MPRVLSDALNEILFERNSRFKARDLADIALVGESMISRVRNDDAELGHIKVQRLSTHLLYYGDTRIAECFVTPDYQILPRGEARADGKIDDELRDMIVALAQLSEAHKEGDTARFDATMREVHNIVNRLSAEGDRL